MTADTYDANSEVAEANGDTCYSPALDRGNEADARARQKQYEIFSQTGKNPTVEQLMDRATD